MFSFDFSTKKSSHLRSPDDEEISFAKLFAFYGILFIYVSQKVEIPCWKGKIFGLEFKSSATL